MIKHPWHWSEKQHQRWAVTRAEGRSHFILHKEILGWGVCMFGAMSLPRILGGHVHNLAAFLFFNLCLWGCGGLFFGAALWAMSEKSFRHYSGPSLPRANEPTDPAPDTGPDASAEPDLEVSWRSHRIGLLCNAMPDMRYLEGIWRSHHTSAAEEFEALVSGFDLKTVFEDNSKGTRVMLLDPSSEASETAVAISLEEGRLLVRRYFGPEELAWLTAHVD